MKTALYIIILAMEVIAFFVPDEISIPMLYVAICLLWITTLDKNK